MLKYINFVEGFPRDAGSRPIADGSKYELELADIADMEARLCRTPRFAAAKVFIDKYLDTPTARVVGIVMSEAAFHWEWADPAWFDQLPDDVWQFRYVVRPDGSVEIV